MGESRALENYKNTLGYGLNTCEIASGSNQGKKAMERPPNFFFAGTLPVFWSALSKNTW